MWHQRNWLDHARPSRRVERNLVDVLHQHLESSGTMAAIIAPHPKRIRMPRSDAMNLDPVQTGARRAAIPTAAQQGDLVVFRSDAAKDLVEMDFSPTRLRVLAILPVHEQDAHQRRPVRRASASNTPLTKRALSTLP